MKRGDDLLNGLPFETVNLVGLMKPRRKEEIFRRIRFNSGKIS